MGVHWSDAERLKIRNEMVKVEIPANSRDLIAQFDLVQESILPPNRRRKLNATSIRSFLNPYLNAPEGEIDLDLIQPKSELEVKVDSLIERVDLMSKKHTEAMNAVVAVATLVATEGGLVSILRMVTSAIRENTEKKS